MSSANGNGMMPHETENAPMTLAQVQAKLKGVKGKKYWRSIDELAGTPEFEAAVAKEFPDLLVLPAFPASLLHRAKKQPSVSLTFPPITLFVPNERFRPS